MTFGKAPEAGLRGLSVNLRPVTIQGRAIRPN